MLARSGLECDGSDDDTSTHGRQGQEPEPRDSQYCRSYGGSRCCRQSLTDLVSLCQSNLLEKVPAAGKRIPNKQQPPVGLAVGQEPKAGAANECQEQGDEYGKQEKLLCGELFCLRGRLCIPRASELFPEVVPEVAVPVRYHQESQKTRLFRRGGWG